MNVCSEFLVESNFDRRNENTDDKFNRLYNEYKVKNEKYNQLKEQNENNIDFKPKINEVSKNIHRSLDDLCKPKIRPNNNKENDEECSFKPDLVTKNSMWNKRVESKYNENNLDEEIKNYIDEKENKILAIKQEVEYYELNKCTFKPKLNKTPE